MDIVEFLRARLDEDEAALREVGDRGMERTFPRLWREVEAKRRIVDEFAGETDRTIAYVLACLALPYAEHPDYRQEWKP